MKIQIKRVFTSEFVKQMNFLRFLILYMIAFVYMVILMYTNGIHTLIDSLLYVFFFLFSLLILSLIYSLFYFYFSKFIKLFLKFVPTLKIILYASVLSLIVSKTIIIILLRLSEAQILTSNLYNTLDLLLKIIICGVNSMFVTSYFIKDTKVSNITQNLLFLTQIILTFIFIGL